MYTLFIPQNMYQFIVTQGVLPPVTLWVAHPPKAIPLTSSTILPYKDVLVLVQLWTNLYDFQVIEALSDQPLVVNKPY